MTEKHMVRMEATAFAERCDIASQSNNVNWLTKMLLRPACGC